MPLRRVPVHPLAVYRIVLGIAALVRCAEAARILHALVQPTTYRIPWVSWAPAMQAAEAYALLGVWAISALMFTLGAYTRFAGTVAGLAMAVVLVIDAQTYSNHLYLLAILLPLVAWAGGGKALSLDTREGGAAATVPAWPVWLVMVQVTAVYLFGALSKVTPDFLAGNVIKYSLPRPLLDALSYEHFMWVVVGSAVSVVMLELFVAVGLWIPRYRRAAMITAVVLHLGMIGTLGGVRLQIAVFAVVMLGSFPLWLGPGELISIASLSPYRRWLHWRRRRALSSSLRLSEPSRQDPA